MPKPDYSHWLTKQQAADAIGCSTKTVEQLAKEKRLHAAMWRRPEGGPRIAVYHPGDVDLIRKEKNPDAEPFMVRVEAEPLADSAPAQSTALAAPNSAEQFMRVLLAVAGASQSSEKKFSTFSEVRLSERLFLTIPEAADYSGLPQSHIRRLMGEGKLEAMKTGAGWRIRRVDLEKL